MLETRRRIFSVDEMRSFVHTFQLRRHLLLRNSYIDRLLAQIQNE